MMTKGLTNNWLTLHDYKSDEQKKDLQAAVMKECGWSMATFYHKIKKPYSISNAQRKMICVIYDVPIEILFPDTETDY